MQLVILLSYFKSNILCNLVTKKLVTPNSDCMHDLVGSNFNLAVLQELLCLLGATATHQFKVMPTMIIDQFAKYLNLLIAKSTYTVQRIITHAHTAHTSLHIHTQSICE